MDILKKIDDVVIDGQVGVQAFANVVEWTTQEKVQYFTLARLTIVLSIAYKLSIDYGQFLATLNDGIRLPLSFILMPVMLIMVFYQINMTQSIAKKGFRNPLRDHPIAISVRAVFLFFLIDEAVRAYFNPEAHLLEVPYHFGLALTFYLTACSKAPPRQQSASNWT